MNKKLGLAVAGALVAFSSAANAGITIPAGDWTVDIGGNVNAYYTHVNSDVTNSEGVKTSNPKANTIGTGLLPAAFGIGAKTRQNDLDIAVQFSFFTGTNANTGAAANASGSALGANTLNIRQAYLTVGDASWGSIKAGRDLGIFGSDAILSDMTLLGVGTGAPAGGSSTLGRIGSGYIYADWKGQFAYTSPNWNGFSFTAGVMENYPPAYNDYNFAKKDLGYEGKVTYDFAANDVTGRVWLSGISQKTSGVSGGAESYTSNGFDIGAKVAYQGFGLVGYYYDGEGLDSQYEVAQGLFNGNGTKSKDSGGYVQATFVVPGVGTKLGASWGESSSTYQGTEAKVETWIVGAYHPLTKSLNIVAEYANADNSYSGLASQTVKTTSLGAILFF